MNDPAAGRGSQARGWRTSFFLWMLVLLSAVTLAVGIWIIRTARQRVAEESRPAASGPTRSRAPDFTLQTPAGETLSLQDLRGQVVLLNFWATWCPPCEAEMPDLQALYRGYNEDHRLTVLGINVEEEADVVKAFAGLRGIAFPLLLDTDGAVTNRVFAVRSLPTSMIIDREGYIRDAWTGQISRAAMLARLERIW